MQHLAVKKRNTYVLRRKLTVCASMMEKGSLSCAFDTHNVGKTRSKFIGHNNSANVHSVGAHFIHYVSAVFIVADSAECADFKLWIDFGKINACVRRAMFAPMLISSL